MRRDDEPGRDDGTISDATANFRKRAKPSSEGPSGPDSPGEGKTGLPDWIKKIIYLHIGMTYGIVVLTGIEGVPFALNDMPLTALVASGLGGFVGLVVQRIKDVISGGVKTVE